MELISFMNIGLPLTREMELRLVQRPRSPYSELIKCIINETKNFTCVEILPVSASNVIFKI